MTKILIATPAYGEMFYTPYVSSVIRLQRLAARNKWDSTVRLDLPMPTSSKAAISC